MNEPGKKELRQYVLDTNILISDPNAPYEFHEHDVVIPMTVLEELDKLKDSNKPLANKDARIAIQVLKTIINGASHSEIASGVRIAPEAGCLSVINDYDKGVTSSLPDSVPDNRIIAATLFLQDKERKKSDGWRKTVLVTKDINLQLKARAAGVECVEDYFNDQQLDDIDYLSSGYVEMPFDWFDGLSEVDCTREGNRDIYHFLMEDLPESMRDSVYLNQYWFNEDQNTVYRVTKTDEGGVDAIAFNKRQLMSVEVFGITPRNLYQAMAMNALMDPDVDIVQLTGPAGSGKTLLALAAAIEQTSSGSDGLYDKVLVTRNTPDMAEGIGYLPGTEEEKMSPWLAAFTDSLEVLAKVDTSGHPDDKVGMTDGMETNIALIRRQSNLQFKSINFMRGRSLQNTYVILDESQNLTPHQMRSTITRVGQGSKMVVLGNLGQIDAKYVTPLTSGLTHAVEKMKTYEGGAVMNLPGGERSRLSSFAEDNL